MIKESHYTDSLYYDLLLTAKCFQLYGEQFFSSKEYPITINEFAILDVIYCNPEICQRDLAKLILKDRANTGRLVEVLEKKGFVQRVLVTRHNRPIKQVSLTVAGENILTQITNEIREELKYVYYEVPEEEIEKARETLEKLQKILGKSIVSQI